jgi:glycosyltransferase 2 family protein
MKGEPASGSRLTSGLDRVFRTALILVPFGVLLNLAISWQFTDRDVLLNLIHLPRGYLYLAMGLALVPWITNALRVLIWARFISHRLSFRDAFRITLGAELASSVFPTSSGGEVFRWGMMVQKGISKGQAASIVTLGYLEDLIFFAVAIPTAVVFSQAWNLPVLQYLGGQVAARQEAAVALLLMGLTFLLFARTLLRMWLVGRLGEGPRRTGLRFFARLRRRMRRTWDDFRSVHRLVIARGKSRFVLTFLITAVQWSCRYSVVTALAFYLGATVDPLLFFLLQWVIFTAMLFVPTPGASGGAEAFFLLVYSALLPGRIVGIATALWRMLTFYFLLAVGSVIFTSMNVADARTRARNRRADGAA